MDSYHLKHLRARLIDSYLAEQKRQRDEFDDKLAELNQKIIDAEAAENQAWQDPEVLIRNSLGAPRKVYHRASNPCGRTKYDGGKQQGFETMRESAAKQLDGGTLKRCSACW
jgi:hypothetical protein